MIAVWKKIWVGMHMAVHECLTLNNRDANDNEYKPSVDEASTAV